MEKDQTIPLTTMLSLWLCQGLIAFLWLAALPTNTEDGLFFGYSASRLGLMGLMLTITGGLALLAICKKPLIFLRKKQFQKFYYIFSLLLATLATAGIIILHALGISYNYIFSAYATRLAPVASWLAISSLEFAFFLAFENKYFIFRKNGFRFFSHTTGFTVIILMLIVCFIAITRLGITPYNDGSWGKPTTPLLEWQILLAIIISLTFGAMEKRWHWLKKDRYTFSLVYLFTCLLWLSQPINPGFFATAPRAPNFEIYPYSDALIYAQYAQSALVGNGFLWPDVPTRPLYITLITWLHFIAGQDYNRVIMLQTLLLAAFPAVLYLVGKELSGRPLGIGLAILAAFRDLTANVAAPFALNYTYTKLFFSEIPTALLLSLFFLLILRWMRKPLPAWYPFLAGGLLGMSTLIRLQSAVVLAVVIPTSYFVISNQKKWLTGSFLIVLGLALAIAPWLIRNYLATGGIVLDNPISQSMVLARRWGGNSGNDLLPHLAGEGDAQYSSRMTGLALESLRNNPKRILGSAVNHFFNNEISTLLVFPVRDKLESPSELIWPSRAFWQSWTGQPLPGQVPALTIYIFFLAVGLAAAFQKNRLAGLLPLGINLVYNAWTALFLSSGDRFLVPVDWTIYLYLFLGALTLSKLLFLGTSSLDLKTQSHLQNTQSKQLPFPLLKLAGVGFIILMCGASLPFTETIFPKLYPSANLPAPTQADNAHLEVRLRGRAIYPRWYKAREGEPGSAKMGYGKADYARLVFFMTGESNTLVIFPTKKMPEYFPNSTEITVLGTLQEGYIQANKISIKKDGILINYQP